METILFGTSLLVLIVTLLIVLLYNYDKSAPLSMITLQVLLIVGGICASLFGAGSWMFGALLRAWDGDGTAYQQNGGIIAVLGVVALFVGLVAGSVGGAKRTNIDP